jgi:hypothetical protein
MTIWFLVTFVAYPAIAKGKGVDFWRKKVEENSQDSESIFNLADAYLKAKQFDDAARYFKQAAALKGDNRLPAQYYLAVAQKNAGQVMEARKSIERLMEQSPDSVLTKKAEALLANLNNGEEEELEEKKGTGYLEVAGGSNSNPQYSSGTTTTADYTTGAYTRDYSTIIGDSFAQAYADLGYDIIGFSNADITGNTSCSFTNFSTIASASYGMLNVGMPLNVWYGNFQTSLQPSVIYDRDNHGVNLVTRKAGWVTGYYTRSWQVDVNLSLARFTSPRSTLDFLEGSSRDMALEGTLYFGGLEIWGDLGFVDSNLSDNEYTTNSYTGLRVDTSISYTLYMFTLGGQVNVLFKQFNYDSYESRTRVDNYLGLGLTLRANVYGGWGLFVGYNSLSNSSNFDGSNTYYNYNYDQSVLRGGVSYGF